MPSPGAILRRLLARRGYLLSRAEPETPPSVPEYLRSIQSRSAAPTSLVCFDNEISMQSEILEAFPEALTFFSCPIFDPKSGTLAKGSVLPSAPPGRFMAVVDIEAFPLKFLLEKLSWLRQAEALLLRGRLGSFWTGGADLCHLAAEVRLIGFRLADVIDFNRLSYLQAPSGRALLACERDAGVRPETTGARYRVIEALTYLSAPIVQRRDFALLAGPGSFGFAAGVLNPGAIVDGGCTYLLPRGERVPWALQKSNEADFFESSQPLLLTLGDDRCVSGASELSTVGQPESVASRTGDYRLFRFRDQLFSNHFVMSSRRRKVVVHRPLRIDQMLTRVGISRLELEKRQLAWCGFPTLDRPLARAEKNWSMFPDGGRLLLLYSFAPYVLMVAQDWPSLNFTTLLEASFTWPSDGDGLPLRNSVNPVDYDDGHWLHIVHRVHPSKRYSFWAVLIDKKTLQPVRATARPLVCGWQSNPAAIIYTCSVLACPAEILLFSGLDDSATALARIPRSRLDAEWVAIERKDGADSPNS